MSSFAIRRTAAAAATASLRKPNPATSARYLTGASINVDHYSSGWDGEMSENKAGKYQIQTFNKISPKVRSSFQKVNGKI